MSGDNAGMNPGITTIAEAAGYRPSIAKMQLESRSLRLVTDLFFPCLNIN
jgi:hypothetical protein